MTAKKTIFILLSLIILAIVALLIFKPGHKQPTIIKLDIPTKNQPTLGKADAPYHVIAFEDLKCRACRNFNNTVADKLKKKYIQNGRAKLTIILIPFLPNSMPAANTALCLNQQKNEYFFKFVDYIYHHQPPESTDWATIPKLVSMVLHATPEANIKELTNCMVKTGAYDAMESNLQLAKKIMNNTISTPAIYINGYKINNPSWYEIQQKLDQK